MTSQVASAPGDPGSLAFLVCPVYRSSLHFPKILRLKSAIADTTDTNPSDSAQKNGTALRFGRSWCPELASAGLGFLAFCF